MNTAFERRNLIDACLHQHKCLRVGFDLALPVVDRFDLGDKGRAGNEPFLYQNPRKLAGFAGAGAGGEDEADL